MFSVLCGNSGEKKVTLMFLDDSISEGQEDLAWRPGHIRKEQYTSLRPVETHMDAWPCAQDSSDDRTQLRLYLDSATHMTLKHNSFPLVSRFQTNW